MRQEAILHFPWDALAALQYALTALSSVFNALYFASYRPFSKRRRVGALALMAVSIALLAQSLHWGLLPLLLGRSWLYTLPDQSRLFIGIPALLGSLLITALILRQLTNRRKK
ncbi:MAG: hypothetical protein HY676_04855 [Chloroflexi bacterium]|nr:hypothetical protein [Chloroflexota bacterium]